MKRELFVGSALGLTRWMRRDGLTLVRAQPVTLPDNSSAEAYVVFYIGGA
jgi:hypothetical protein